MMKGACASLVLLGLGINIAAAVTAPKLPASAKKLSGAEISALFDGATMSFESYAHPNFVTGTANFDLKNRTQTGSWEAPAVKTPSFGVRYGLFMSPNGQDCGPQTPRTVPRRVLSHWFSDLDTKPLPTLYSYSIPMKASLLLHNHLASSEIS